MSYDELKELFNQVPQTQKRKGLGEERRRLMKQPTENQSALRHLLCAHVHGGTCVSNGDKRHAQPRCRDDLQRFSGIPTTAVDVHRYRAIASSIPADTIRAVRAKLHGREHNLQQFGEQQ